MNTKPQKKIWVLPLCVAITTAIIVFFASDAFFFVQRTHERVDSLSSFLNAEGIQTETTEWPDMRGLIVDDCFGDDGLFLGKALDYDATCRSNSALLTVKYCKTSYGACMYFYIYSTIPFNGTTTQIVFCKHTLW